MRLKKGRLFSLIPILIFGVFATITLCDRAASRAGKTSVWFDLDVLRSVEHWWYDVKMKYRSDRSYAPVTVAAIDDASVQRFGRWPWSRGVFAELIDELYEAGAKSVVFDVVFSEPEYQSKELERTFKVPVPGRKQSLQQMFKLNARQVTELAGLLPEIGDQYLGQSIWHHADTTVLGYFWRSAGECKILPTPATNVDASAAFGALPIRTWFSHVELILRNGFRLASAKDFPDDLFSPPTALGPLQLCPTINRGAVGALGKRQGFFNAQPDVDGVFRRALTLVPLKLTQENLAQWQLDVSKEGIYLFPSLSLSAVMAEYGVETIAPEWQNYVKLRLKALTLASGKNLAPIPLRSDGTFLIDFSKRGGTSDLVPTISLARAGYWTDTEKTRLRDKVVMIGPTSTGVFDLRPNPVDAQGAGVYLHAAATAQILENLASDGAYLGIQTAPLGVQLFVLWAFLFTLTLSLVYARRALATSFWWPVILLLVAADVMLFRRGWSTDFALVALTWSLCLAAITLILYLLEERERIFMKNAFSRYVSPEIVRRIEENPSVLNLAGERKELSILFCDIRGFTSVSEALEPDALRSLLNAYFKPMTEAIQEAGGTVDKFIGDAIMALFGAPLYLECHESAAVQAAERMLVALTKLHMDDPRFAEINLRIGVAVASGLASVGNMGTDKIFNYTALGDVVNVASRIESLTKHYGVPLLIAESTYARLAAREQRRWRPIDRVRIAGKSQALLIFDLPSTHITIASVDELRSDYDLAFAAYVRGEWGAAMAGFGALAEYDAVSRQMLRRCELGVREARNSEWDGVWNFDHK